MTDITALAKRLRARTKRLGNMMIYPVNPDGDEAADLLEAQAKEIAEKDARITGFVEMFDKMMGTPCEQVRHGYEVEELRARIAELHKEVRIMDSEYKTAIARIAELEAENEKLREVLKPFANAANNFDSMPFKNAEEWFVYSGVLDASGYSGAISVADLRAARNGEK